MIILDTHRYNRNTGNFHGDPADRLIVASCFQHKVALVSKDDKIKNWQYIQLVW